MLYRYLLISKIIIFFLITRNAYVSLAMEPTHLMSQRSFEILQTITADIQKATDLNKAIRIFQRALLSPSVSHRELMRSPIVHKALIKKMAEHGEQIDQYTAQFIKVMPGAKEWKKNFLPNDASAIKLISKALVESIQHPTHACIQVGFWLEIFPSINIKDQNGDTLIMLAVKNNNYELVKLLLDKEADPCIPTAQGLTTLMHAARHNNVEIIKLLLKAGVSIDAQDNEGNTALMHAVFGGARGTVTFFLISRAVRVNTLLCNNRKQTALDIAIKKEFFEIESLLKAYNKNKQYTLSRTAEQSLDGESNKRSPLELLPAKIIASTVKHILQEIHGSGVALDNLKKLALVSRSLHARIMCCPIISAPIIDFLATSCYKRNLVKASVALGTRGAQKWLKTALKTNHYLVKEAFNYFLELMRANETKKMRFIIDAHINVDIQDTFGNTMLIHAARSSYLTAVRLLLFAHARPDIQNNFGDTALMHAVSTSNCQIVECLLNANASTSLKNRDGETVLIWAIYRWQTNMIKILLAAGADVHAKDKKGNTALSKALESGNKSAIKLLLDQVL